MKWSSSNAKVVKVSKKGVIKAVRKGTAKVTCQVRTKQQTYTLRCKVTCKTKLTKAENAYRNYHFSSKITSYKLYDIDGNGIPEIIAIDQEGYWSIIYANSSGTVRQKKNMGLGGGHFYIASDGKGHIYKYWRVAYDYPVAYVSEQGYSFNGEQITLKVDGASATGEGVAGEYSIGGKSVTAAEYEKAFAVYWNCKDYLTSDTISVSDKSIASALAAWK